MWLQAEARLDALCLSGPYRDVALCVQWRWAGGDGGQRVWDVLWIQNYASPVVAFYIWQREGLRKVMHINVAVETLRYLTFMSGEVGRITKWKYPFPKETEAKSKLT